jgi:hypothetical protein
MIYDWKIIMRLSFLTNVCKNVNLGSLAQDRILMSKYSGSTAIKYKSRDNLVGVATGYGLDDQSSVPGRVKFFLLYVFQPGSWALFSVLKRPVCETDHSPPFSSKIKNGGAIPPFPHISSCHSA